jgi:hypothetical protein
MKTIASFPDPYPGELFYSCLSRYHERIGIFSNKSFAAHCFGSRNVIATVEFPSHLASFISGLPTGHYLTVDRIINDHTLLPYFLPFLPLLRREQLQHQMKGANGMGIYHRVGLMASSVRSKQKLMYCPACIKDDQVLYGKYFWHRDHQAPGVQVCHIHGVYLIESQIAPRQSMNRQSYITLENATADQELDPIIICTDKRLLQLSADTAALLEHGAKFKIEGHIRKIYQYYLYRKGLCHYDGKLKSANKIKSRLKEFFSTQLLQSLDSTIVASEDSWVLQLPRKRHSVQHPLRHLLMMQFLGLTPLQVFSTIIPDPFGKSPWPCLNPICHHYLKPVITQVKTFHSKYTSGRPIGEFACNCGFIYRRTGPDNHAKDRLRREKIISYGSIWQHELIKFWKDKVMSVRKIATMLGVDSQTIKKQAQKLGLPFPRKGPRTSNISTKNKKPTKTVKTTALRTKHRQTWTHMLLRHRSSGTKMLRQKNPKVYMWLYRYDNKWLTDHKPNRRKRKTQEWIDWKARDTMIANLIKDKLNCFTQVGCKPVRITSSRIGRTIGHAALLQQHIAKMPKTAMALSKLVESQDDFHIRKIHWAYEFLKRECPNPRLWQVIRRANIWRFRSNPIVIATLEAMGFNSTLRF